MPEKTTIEELKLRVKELENAERVQRVEREKLEQILASLDTGLSLINPDNTIAWVNNKIKEMFPKGDPIGQICHKFYESADEPCEPCPTTHCFVSGHVCKEERFNPANGRWYYIISQPIKDFSGKVINALEGVTDITERKQVEDALKQSEGKYRFLTEKMADIVWTLDRDFRTTYVSPSIEKVLGFTPEERKRQTLEEIVTPESLQEVQMMFLEELRRDEEGSTDPDRSVTIEVKYYRKDGSTVWMENSVKAIRDPAGAIVGMHGVSRDITERKKAEEALRESEKKFRSVFDLSPQAIALTDVETGKFIEVNQKLSELSKYRKEELIGRTTTELGFYTKADRNRFIKELSESGEVHGLEIDFRIKNGSKVDTLMFATIIELAGKSFILSIFIDVTERKQMEKDLRESEEKYRLLIENANDAIFIAQDGIVKFPNPRTLETVGYSAEELAKIPFIDLIHPEDRDVVLERHLRRLKGEDLPSTYSFRVINKKGEQLWGELSTVRIDWEGRPATLNFLRDITQQKKLEAQLGQSQKMEAIGTLAGGIAHEFNNILGIIIGNTELAIDDVPEWNPAKECLKEIRTASLRAKDVVRHILSFARKSHIERKPIQIAQIIKDTLKLMRASIPTTIDIHQNILCNYDTVLADPTQINQVLMNLCTNAAHAMREKGGVLEVKLQNTKLDEDMVIQYEGLTPGKYVRLTVRDTGHGIDPEIMDRIFDPFFTTKGLAEGTGMGLSVVHGIVRSHDGAIKVKSDPGHGTIIEIFLPLIDAEAEVAGEEFEVLPTGTERVLFVDDERSIVKIADQMLERLGYEVTTKTSSVEALELFEAEPDRFDLIITDMTMPHMTGDRLARKLFMIRSDIPVILCTGYSERIDEDKAKEMGIRAYAPKPLVMRDLAVTIRQVLGGK